MAVSAALVAEARKAVAELSEHGREDLSALETHAEVFAYIVALARHHGIDEADAVELACRVNRLDHGTVRRNEQVMRALGYVAVADRMRKLARRKKIA
jgi:hypothetical protein